MKNGNETEKYGVTTDQLDALFARNNAQSMAEREARQRAAAWPTEVEQMLKLLADEIRLLKSRISKLESLR